VIWWFPYILAVCVLLFAFTTIVSWSYYMSRAWAYLLGYSRLSMNALPRAVLPRNDSRRCDDRAAGRGLYRQPRRAVTIPNIIGLYLLAPTIRA
jgi:AGCS family alanine or glycine:cation symporter